MRYSLTATFAALLISGSWVATASADDPVIDFNIDALHLGIPTISFAGGANPLVGSGINVDTVTGLATAANSDVVRDLFDGAGSIIHDAQLSFITGNYYAFSGTSLMFFNGGGSLTISGSVDLNNNGSIDGGDIVNQTLLTGTFDTPVTVITTGGRFRLIGGGLFAFVNADLLDYYGYADTQVYPFDGSLNLQFRVPSGTTVGQAFTSTTVLSGDVAVTVVPEVSTMLLCSIAMGVGGLGVWRSRQRTA